MERNSVGSELRCWNPSAPRSIFLAPITPCVRERGALADAELRRFRVAELVSLSSKQAQQIARRRPARRAEL